MRAEVCADERAGYAVVVSRRNSFLNDLFTLATRMHWLAALASAAALWALLDYLSQRWGSGRLAASTLMRGGGGYIILGTFARLLRYVLPAVLVAGAFVGMFTRWRRGHLFAVAANAPLKLLDGMNWQDFEKVVADAFTHNGFGVVERGGAQADGGVDLVLTFPAQSPGGSNPPGAPARRYLVQCKQWKSKPVDVATVRELLGVVAASAADGGFVVSAGEFTSAARAFADGRNIILIDNARLHAMMISNNALWPNGPALERGSAAKAPSCPTCYAVMVKRTAKRGRGAGNPFWGCSKFPDCRGTRLIV